MARRSEGRPSYYGFTNPLKLQWFFSVIGAEYCHTYFWIAKDLAWMQSWRRSSIFFGLCALVWSLLILYHSLRTLNWHELWNFIALFLWLFANFWWMLGEAHDYEFPNERPLSSEHNQSSAQILQAALLWVLFYYCVILPFNILPCSVPSLLEYDDGSLLPRLPCFTNFRQYENLHMLFWIAKDLAWNRLIISGWVDSTVDIVHFSVVFIWVIGNSVWAFGDFFLQDYSEPLGMWTLPPHAFLTARWYSSWILFSACIPILIMYGVWGTLTLQGVLVSEETSSGEDQDGDGVCRNVFDWDPVESELDHIFCEDTPSLRAVSSIALMPDGGDAEVPPPHHDIPSPQLGVVQRASGRSKSMAPSPDNSPSKPAIFSMSHVYRYLGLTGREKHSRSAAPSNVQVRTSPSGKSAEVKDGDEGDVSMVKIINPMQDLEEAAGGAENGDEITEHTGLLRKDSKQL
eukprot:gene23144-28127_t